MSKSLTECIVKNNDYKIIDCIFNNKFNCRYNDKIIKKLFKNVCKMKNFKFMIYVFNKIIEHNINLNYIYEECLLLENFLNQCSYDNDMIYQIFKILLDKNLYINEIINTIKYMNFIDYHIIKLIFDSNILNNTENSRQDLLNALIYKGHYNLIIYILKCYPKKLYIGDILNIFEKCCQNHYIAVYIFMYYKHIMRDDDYNTLLRFAIESNNLKLIKLLKDYYIENIDYLKICYYYIDDNITKYLMTGNYIFEIFKELHKKKRISMIIKLLKSKYYDIIKNIKFELDIRDLKKIKDIKFIISLNMPNFRLNTYYIYDIDYHLLSELTLL